MINAQPNYNQLLAKLDEFIRKYYKNQLVKGGIYAVAIGAVAFLCVSLLEYYGHFDTAVRTVFFFLLLGILAFVLTRFLFIPLAKLYRIGAILSYTQASEIIGTHFPTVKDKLLNTLQLKDQSDRQGEGYGLLQASIDQKIAELKPVPFQTAINLKANTKYLRYAVPPVLVLIIILFANARILTDSTKRLVNYNKHFEREAPFTFTILNDSLAATQHEDFVLDVKLTGQEIPAEVFLEMNGNKFKMQPEGKLHFRYTFKNLQKDFGFYLFADNFYSAEKEFKVLAKPLLAGFEVQLTYPAYTGKKPETLANAGDLSIPQGTQVKWRFTTKNVDRLDVSFKDSLFALDNPGRGVFEFSKRFLKGDTYYVTSANKQMKSSDSVVYNVQVIADAFPRIEVEEKKDSLNSKMAYFVGHINDDYGFRQLSFHYRFLRSGNQEKVKQPLKNLPLSIDKSSNDQQFYYIWALDEIGIEAADEVEYYFEVFDNDGVNGSKRTRSEVKVYKAPTLQEVKEEVNRSSEVLKGKMEKAIEQTKEVNRSIENIQKKLLDKKNLNWEDKKQIEDLLKKQEQLEKTIEELKNENLQKNQKEQEFKKVDEELLEKQRQLEKLFDELMTPEMKELMKQLEEMMKNLDKDKVKEQLEKMEMNEKDVNKQLDRMLELYKEFELEKNLEEAIDKLDELGKEQEKLAEETGQEKAPEEKLAEEQEKLNKELEELKKDFKDIEEKNKELEKPKELDNPEQDLKDIEKDMQEGSQELQKKNNKKAAQKQQKAAQKMKEMAARMKQKMQQEEEEQHAEDYRTLRDLLENLVQLSFDQEDLMQQMGTVTGYNPQFVEMVQRQRKIKDDARIIEDSLLALSKRVAQIKTFVNTEIGKVNSNISQSLKDFGDRRVNDGRSRQQYVMTSLNNLAVMLSEVLKNMQDEMNSEAEGEAGEGKKKKQGKPGKGGKGELSNMKEMQKQLNEQLKKMKEGQQKGPGEGKGQGQGGTMGSEGWAKMAAQQEYLRRKLQEMQKMMEGEGNRKGAGEMQKTIEMMEQVEKDLVNKRLNLETIKRQQQIETRLLEHEKAEQEREMDDKRESNEGKTPEKRMPPSLQEYLKQKEKETELLKTVPPSLKPYYKEKTKEYFRNIGQ